MENLEWIRDPYAADRRRVKLGLQFQVAENRRVAVMIKSDAGIGVDDEAIGTPEANVPSGMRICDQ